MPAELEYELDYDWKDADGSDATALVAVNADTDKEVVKCLEEGDDDIHREFGNKYASFVPDQVNDINLNDLDDADEAILENYQRTYCWAVAACLFCLKKAPGTRKFALSGVIE